MVLFFCGIGRQIRSVFVCNPDTDAVYTGIVKQGYRIRSRPGFIISLHLFSSNILLSGNGHAVEGDVRKAYVSVLEQIG